tara:strand:- start:54 stop:734 length:681 start_codon:yes stop_codon:yes gene_type:complete
MLYIIGLGLNESGFSYEAFNVIKNSRIVYLENYTVDFPYEKEDLEELIQKKIKNSGREFVENFEILKEAKDKNVALLVYGNPLMATTHVSLLQEAKKQKIPARVIHGTSVMDAVAETGLQTYKFGKTTSIPKHEASSFLDVIKDNKKINAHTLILIDIGLGIGEMLKKLGKINEKIVLCSALGTKNQKILYKKPSGLKKEKIKKPFCIIIPGKLHFAEEEFLKNFN